MRTRRSLALAVLIALQLSPLWRSAAAETLDDLLAETRKDREAEAAADAAREREFLASRDRQKEMVEQAQAEWNSASARNQRLSSEFDANEAELTELETKLRPARGTSASCSASPARWPVTRRPRSSTP